MPLWAVGCGLWAGAEWVVAGGGGSTGKGEAKANFEVTIAPPKLPLVLPLSICETA